PVNLSLAGGVFANVKLNMAMSHMAAVNSIYIFPNMGDGGLGVGAALNVHGKAPQVVPHMYLGTSYSTDEIAATLRTSTGITMQRPQDLTERIAQELAGSKIVARSDGAMEYGPRALGNRSILYHAADPSVNA